jgi:2-polyprenyl-3-methyl-5-hydroxy-6-metoxy-1,4-benzoquinol methylase
MSQFWKNINLPNHSCTNQSFFRFLSGLKFKFIGAKILEIGFYMGDELNELKKRGCLTYGLDINLKAIENFKKKYQKKNILYSNLSKQRIPFNCKFDLIYHNDFIYYLNDKNILKHFQDVFNNLIKNGLFLFSFIEAEFVLKKTPKKIINSKEIIFKKVTKADNKIRILKRKNLIELALKMNFKLFGDKVIIESFDNFSKKYKAHRYLAFKK